MNTFKKYNWSDLCIAGCFLLLGFYLTLSGSSLPAGAGFFPMGLGIVILILSVGLIFQGIQPSNDQGDKTGQMGVLLGVVLLIGVYLALWGVGWFSVSTFVFLAIFLRMMRESWRTGITVSAVLTTVVTLAFKYGLHVSLD